ncbi:MAG: hypothetical protein IJE91_00280 [Clostridia bacterium]|nr:hypothetical protein [Clostridia bacterium]
MEFDFKKLFKNKFFLIGLVLTILIFVCVALARLSMVFYVITCFLGAALCFMLAVYYVLKTREVKSDNKADLIPLTHEEREKVNRHKRFGNMNNVLKVILFACAGVAFIVFGIKMI